MPTNLILMELSLGPKNFDELVLKTNFSATKLAKLMNYLLQEKQVSVTQGGKYELTTSARDFLKRTLMHEYAFTCKFSGLKVNYLRINSLEYALLENMFREMEKFIADIQNKHDANKVSPSILIWGKSLLSPISSSDSAISAPLEH